ncbi:MAG: YchJ family protein [Ramlibacter sp.]
MKGSGDPPCWCGRPLPFAQCCGRYLRDFEGTPAPDAETLMRSRYSAYVTGNAGYLLATWHASRRPADIGFEPGVKWLGLDVRAHVPVDADHAEVEFVARSRLAGRATRLHERSRFVREGGRWYYLDGEMR